MMDVRTSVGFLDKSTQRESKGACGCSEGETIWRGLAGMADPHRSFAAGVRGVGLVLAGQWLSAWTLTAHGT